MDRNEQARDDHSGHPPDATDEKGRDLTLLALAIIIINEAIFTGYVVTQDQDALVAQAGRFALKAGMAWLTWQGFTLSRWILVVLVAAAIVAAPWALIDAWRAGTFGFAAVMTATVAGYLVAGWLLAFSADVGRFIRQRAEARQRDVFRG